MSIIRIPEPVTNITNNSITTPKGAEVTDLEEADLMNLLNYLPEGWKTIFNLFGVEGYSHKEIAQQLQISEGTSNSHLNAAKTKLKDLVTTFYYQKAR